MFGHTLMTAPLPVSFSEVKHVPAQLVLRWVTTLEPWVLNIFVCLVVMH